MARVLLPAPLHGRREPAIGMAVHGWGMHSGMWMQARDLLSQHFELHLVDLPGMGHSDNVEVYKLDTVAEKIAQETPTNAYVLGWSLGGLIATKIALMTPIKKLILVGKKTISSIYDHSRLDLK